jgi:hypothetical protein
MRLERFISFSDLVGFLVTKGINEKRLKTNKYHFVAENIGSIFESTNDISIIGFYRTFFAVLSVFFSPTCWAMWDLHWLLLNTLLTLLRKCLVLCGLRKRYDVGHYEANELEDDSLDDIEPSVNYNVYLVELDNELA